MANVSAQSLAQAVAAHLLRLIHRGEIGPGDRLPAERELAEQLGVARISLREAIKSLRDDGYVEVRRGAHGGTYVLELDEPVARWQARMRTEFGEFDDIIDYRIALESEAAGLAAARRTKSHLAILRTSIRALERAGTRAEVRLTDTQFHAGLARASGNARLASAIEAARADLFALPNLIPGLSPSNKFIGDHQTIYQAVCQGNRDAATAAMREHIENTRTHLRDIVFGSSNSSTL